MKKALAVLLGLNALLLVGLLLKEKDPLVHAEGGAGEVPVANGDVNADGEIDLSDAVYILESLFMGGPDIVPIECPACDSCCLPLGAGGLPRTGQTFCFDKVGNNIDCASADYPGQDAFYRAGCSTVCRFIDNEDGTVTDTCTGLQWQKGTADVDGSGSIGVEDRLDWQAALKYCDSLGFAGHDDWRLPNVRELESIVDYNHYRDWFPVLEADSDWYWWYWSSTSLNYVPGACLVALGNGYVNSYNKADVGYVRAVRSVP